MNNKGPAYYIGYITGQLLFIGVAILCINKIVHLTAAKPQHPQDKVPQVNKEIN